MGASSAFPALAGASDAQAQAQTSAAVAVTPLNLAGRASFRAHKNASDQTGIATATFTKVTFDTEDWDTGGYFATSTWTPPAGKVRLSCGLYCSAGLTAATNMQVSFYKNGSQVRNYFVAAGASGDGMLCYTANDNANGTDTYEVWVRGTSASTITVSGATTLTWFEGEQI